MLSITTRNSLPGQNPRCFLKSLNMATQGPAFCWLPGHNYFLPHVFLEGHLPLRVEVKDQSAATSILGTALQELTVSLVSILGLTPELEQAVRSQAASFLPWGRRRGGKQEERGVGKGNQLR